MHVSIEPGIEPGAFTEIEAVAFQAAALAAPVDQVATKNEAGMLQIPDASHPHFGGAPQSRVVSPMAVVG